MPKLGIVADDQFAQEVNNSRATVFVPRVFDASVIDKPDIGRGQGNNGVPSGLRKIIGETAVIEGRAAALELAKDFGVSPSSVSAYTKGATSTATIDKPEKTLINYLNSRKNRASKKALKALHSTLDIITPEKLAEVTKVKDLATIAKDLASVAKSMEPENSNATGDNTPKFVVYAPTIRDERTYETVIVNDNY